MAFQLSTLMTQSLTIDQMWGSPEVSSPSRSFPGNGMTVRRLLLNTRFSSPGLQPKIDPIPSHSVLLDLGMPVTVVSSEHKVVNKAKIPVLLGFTVWCRKSKNKQVKCLICWMTSGVGVLCETVGGQAAILKGGLGKVSLVRKKLYGHPEEDCSRRQRIQQMQRPWGMNSWTYPRLSSRPVYWETSREQQVTSDNVLKDMNCQTRSIFRMDAKREMDEI